MSRIRARDTKPEIAIRRGLHALGLRYRLHDRKLPGTPDLVFSGRQAVVFVHGCFWHGHDCPLGVRPRSNAAFWDTKIARNQERDRGAVEELAKRGWRIAVVWECALRGTQAMSEDTRTQIGAHCSTISKVFALGAKATDGAKDEAAHNAMGLLEIMLCDLNRAADALESIAYTSSARLEREIQR